MLSLVLLVLGIVFLPFIVANKEQQQLFTLPLIPHHVQRERRGLVDADLSDIPRRRARVLQGEDPLTIGALYQGYGTHYVDLWVGSPQAQRQTVIVDTGSGVTAFPCSGCNDCGKDYHIDEFFQESQSESFHKLTCDECTRGSCKKNECHIGMSYAEGSSWSAYEGKDLQYAGGPHDEPLTQQEDNGGNDVDPLHASAYAFQLKFGCQTKITGLFKTQLADGIMGMDSASTSYWNQMHTNGKLTKKRFALCYSRQPTLTRNGTEAGALTFGGPDTRLHTSPMVYSGGTKSGVGAFSVKIRKIYLRMGGGGESATSTTVGPEGITVLDIGKDSLTNMRAIVDSGTTDTYFSSVIAHEFNKVFESMTGTKYGHDPVDLSAKQMEALPTILLQFVGDKDYNKDLYGKSYVTGLAGENGLDAENPYDVIVAIPPSHYMEYDNKKEKYIARFYINERGKTVLGGNTIMGHNVYFDIEYSRIGWAESKCDYTDLVNKYDTTSDHSEPETLPETSEKESVDKDSTEKPKDKDKPPASEPEDSTHEDKDKPPASEPDDSTHEEDKHVDEPGEVGKDAAAVDSSTKFCSDMKCRGSLMGALLGVIFVGLFVARSLSSRRRRASMYHGTELEVPTLYLDEEDAVDFSTRYRDNPEGEEESDEDDDEEEDGVAEEGAGYEDDDELDPHEIA